MVEIRESPQVHIDTRDNVKKLLESSLRLEKLTTRLNWLTIVLTAETVVLVAVAILRL